jgi:hypothetical protein
VFTEVGSLGVDMDLARAYTLLISTFILTANDSIYFRLDFTTRGGVIYSTHSPASFLELRFAS